MADGKPARAQCATAREEDAAARQAGEGNYGDSGPKSAQNDGPWGWRQQEGAARQQEGVARQADEGAAVAASAAGPLAEAISIMARLRGPGGCPWDREQTFDSIKRHTLEETYEVFDAIERRAWPELKDELGDLLLQVLFYAQMAAEAGYFDIGEVAAGLNAKLARRHPHIFPPKDGPDAGKLADASDADAVLRNWEQIKRAEKRVAAELKNTASAADSALHEIPRSMPATMEAGKLGAKAAKVNFDWPDVEGLFDKLQEEIDELKAEMVRNEAAEQDCGAAGNARVEEELGDLLFTAVNLARHLKVDAESVLRAANAKFRKRFGAMEKAAGGFDALAELTPAELDALWNRAKRADISGQQSVAGSGPDSTAPDGLKA